MNDLITWIIHIIAAAAIATFGLVAAILVYRLLNFIF